MHLTRRQMLASTAAGVLGAAGVYELVDRLTAAPARAPASTLPPEQHLLLGQRVVRSDGVAVIVPPLHHQVVTLELRTGHSKAALADARGALEDALRSVEGRFEPTPAGLGVTVAWGLPYFRRYVPGPMQTHLPLDRRASRAGQKPVRVLIDAVRFPSDPHETILEHNDAALLLRSDSLANIAAAADALVTKLGMWRATSIRRGFVGGGFDGSRGLPKQMALAAGVSGADLIPDQAELFLGFTSTQGAALGPPRIANIETLGYSNGGPGEYFRQGTTMHLSHLFEDLEAWYLNFDHGQRLSTLFRPDLEVPEHVLTVRQGPAQVTSVHGSVHDFRRHGAIGHSAAIQPTSRLAAAVRGVDGTVYPKGTAVPHRADFNTLDNPFAWSAHPAADAMAPTAAAGLHFVVFNPTSDDFHRNRLAMDGVFPDGTRLPFKARDRGQGINSILTTTHRQNFLVPPRRHRSFPLSELL
jgi:hypothetical protein